MIKLKKITYAFLYLMHLSPLLAYIYKVDLKLANFAFDLSNDGYRRSFPDLFTDRRKRKDKDSEDLIDELYRQIGQLKVELDWLKKNRKNSCRREEERTDFRESHDFTCPAV